MGKKKNGEAEAPELSPAEQEALEAGEAKAAAYQAEQEARPEDHELVVAKEQAAEAAEAAEAAAEENGENGES